MFPLSLLMFFPTLFSVVDLENIPLYVVFNPYHGVGPILHITIDMLWIFKNYVSLSLKISHAH